MGYGSTSGQGRWPGGRIPYEIDQLSFPPGSPGRQAIDNAVTMWNTAAAVVALAPHANEPDFIQFVPDQLNTQSDVGRKGGKQLLQCAFFQPVNGGASVAAGSQGSERVDCFYIDDAGSLRVSWVTGNGDWAGPSALTNPNTAPPSGAVATGIQGDDQLDVFFVDNNGAVNVHWTGATGPWQRATLTGPGAAPAGAALCTGRQGDDQLDVFWVDGAGAVNLLWAGATGAWQHATLTGPGAAPVGAPLCTGRQGGDQLDLFWIDGAGAVNAMWAGATGAWQQGKLTGNGAAPSGAALCTGHQGDGDQLDLFWVDGAGAVNIMWVGATGPWKRATLTGPGSALAGGGLCTGHQGDGDQLDLFWVDGAGAVNLMWVGATGPWQRATLAGVTAHRGGALATARQGDSQLDLFFVDDAQALNVMWAGPTGPWKGPGQFLTGRFQQGSIAHEIGHAAGLHHEHQRPDSANFVTIVGGGPPNYGPEAFATTIGPYDYDSIMHYPPTNTPPTLSVKNPPGAPAGVNVGQRNHLSVGDIASARYLYGQIATPNAALAAGHQSPDQLDVFVVDAFGAIAVLWVGGSGVWQGPAELTAPGVAPAVRGVVATGIQGDDQLDAFYVDNSGAINVLWAGATGPWNQAALTGPGAAPVGAAVCTGRQGADQLDVFWVDGSGAVNVLWAGATGAWQRAALTGPQAAPVGAAVCTGRQGADQLDVFWVDGSGAVNVLWAGATGAWQRATLTEPQAAPPGQSLCTGRQGDDQLDLFWVDDNGAVNIMWAGATGPWKRDKLTPDGAASTGGNLCTATQGEDQLDLFYVGKDGGPVNVSWVGSDGRWNGPSVALGTSVQALRGAPGPMSPPETLAALAVVNVLTSIEPVSDLLEWLGDPIDTPYPALAQALLNALAGRKLAAPVFIDVVRGFYEEDLGQPSPRTVADVHTEVLQTAVVRAYNENNGTELSTFSALLV